VFFFFFFYKKRNLKKQIFSTKHKNFLGF